MIAGSAESGNRNESGTQSIDTSGNGNPSDGKLPVWQHTAPGVTNGTFWAHGGIVAGRRRSETNDRVDPTDGTMRLILALFMTPALFNQPLAARQGEDSQGSRAQRSSVAIAAGLGDNGYNRLEGFPFQLGIAARSEGPEPFLGRAVAIIRTDAAAGLDAVGYSFRGEKLFLGSRRVAVGVEFYSEVRAIESRGISNIENSLSAGVFHSDYRDYHNRQGFVAFASYAPRNSPFSAGIEARTERHDLVASGNPGSIFENNAPWRLHPLIAEGKVHSASAAVRYDNRGRRPAGLARGWKIDAEIMQTFGGDLNIAEEVGLVLPDGTRGPPLAGLPTMEATFTKGFLDVRRYNAVGDASLNFRFVAAGILNNEVLPPQFQHSLGGPGSLPGLPGFSGFADDPVDVMPAMDCGARDFRISTSQRNFLATRFFPFYGCDRYVLFQAQLEGYFGFQIGDADLDFRDEGLALNLELIPRWILFFDAAQAWAQGNIGPFPRSNEDLKYDAGGGIAFGDLGFYLAVPLEGDDKNVQFVVRLGSRF